MDRFPTVLRDQPTRPRRLIPIAILAALTLVAAVPGFLLRAHTAPTAQAYAAPATEAQAEHAEEVFVARSAASGGEGRGRRVVVGVAVNGKNMHVTVNRAAWQETNSRYPGAERRLLEDDFAAAYRQNHPQGYVGDELNVEYADENGRVFDVEPLQP
jgi:hypothetical protein